MKFRVKHLIKLLEKVDPEAELVVEGCDCASDCSGISWGKDSYSGQILLRRNGGCFEFDEIEIINSEKDI